jgi:D-sedoheptulose 7-phosphate isomerase
MKLPVFVDALRQVLALIEVTDGRGSLVDLTAGFDQALAWIGEMKRAGGKVIFVGNGGSAAIASHQAVDYWKNGGVRAIAFNDPALLTCVGNDYGFEQTFAKPIEMFADPDDLVIAISSSGRSANILNAARAARVKARRLVTMSGFAADNPLRGLGDLNFYVPSDTYGLVEISHLSICHGIADRLMEGA